MMYDSRILPHFAHGEIMVENGLEYPNLILIDFLIGTDRHYMPVLQTQVSQLLRFGDSEYNEWTTVWFSAAGGSRGREE